MKEKAEKALKSLGASYKTKNPAEWLVEMTPHEEFVLKHMLLQGDKKSKLFGRKLGLKHDKDVKSTSAG